MTIERPAERFIFRFQQAKWRHLRAFLRSSPWFQRLGSQQDAHVAAEFLTRTVLDAAKQFIPYELVSRIRSSHPWVDAACLRAIEDKNSSRGTPDFVSRQSHCSRVLRDAYLAHVGRIKRRLVAHAGNQKKWWKLSSALTLRKASSSSTPALRKARGDKWITDPFDKAELFAETFRSKSGFQEKQFTQAKGGSFVLNVCMLELRAGHD